MPAELEALIDASLTEVDVSRQLFEHLAEAVGDPAGAQRLDGTFLRDRLAGLIDGSLAAKDFFDANALPAPADGTLGFIWLMCTESIGGECVGSVGNLLDDVLDCANTAQRRWTAEFVEADGRFAAGLFCEYSAPSAMIETFQNVAARCAEQYLHSVGVSAKRVEYLDSLAAEVVALPTGTGEEILQEMLRKRSAAGVAAVSLRRDDYSQPDDGSCPKSLGVLTNGGNRHVDGDYGVAVIAVVRALRVAATFG